MKGRDGVNVIQDPGDHSRDKSILRTDDKGTGVRTDHLTTFGYLY